MKGNETLLDKAETNVHVATLLLSDNSLINLAAFHIQQAYELMYAHVLEMYGLKYSFSHSIKQLIEDCIKYNIIFPYNVFIAGNAKYISDMKVKARYEKNYEVDTDLLSNALTTLRVLLRTVNELEDLSAVEFYKTNKSTNSDLADEVALAHNYYPNNNAKQFIVRNNHVNKV